MQRFVSKRSSSSVDLYSSSSNDVRTVRGAIALSVGLSWPPVKRWRSAGRPSWQQLWECTLQEHILHHLELPHCPLTAAGLVATRRDHRPPAHVDPIVRDWFLDVMDRWRTVRRWGMQQCLAEVRRLCPRMFEGIAPAEASLGRRTLLLPADMTRLSEHITWVKQLLRGMRLSWKKPARCVKELHSPEQQHANTHRLFIKLCWLMDKHAVSADRVDETSCRLVLVHQIGWGPPRRQTSSAAGHHEGGRDTHGRLQHGPWPAGHVGAGRVRGQDRRRLAGAALAGAHSSHHVRELLGQHDHDPVARVHIGRRDERKQRRTIVDPSLGRGRHPRQ